MVFVQFHLACFSEHFSLLTSPVGLQSMKCGITFPPDSGLLQIS